MRLQVLAVIDSLGAGGAERSFLELLGPLRDQGIELGFACLDRRPHGVEEMIRRSGARVELLDGPSFVSQTRSLRTIIKEVQPHLVHTTLFRSDLLGRIATRGLNLPVLTSIVNTGYDANRLLDPKVSSWKLGVTRRIDGFTARHATDRFHALTRSAATAAVDALGIDTQSITVVPRARDRRRFEIDRLEARTRIRQEFGLGNDPVVIAVGRQEFQKAHPVLVEAIARVRRSGLGNVRLVIAGRPGNASASISDAIERNGLGDAVVMPSYREDVPDLLAAADVFAFPSYFEGFGGALIEAMAMEVPIVCSSLPVLEEVLTDPSLALEVPPGDVDALAGALREGLISEESAIRARRAREVFEHRYTIEAVAPAMADLYRDTATLGQSSPAAHRAVSEG